MQDVKIPVSDSYTEWLIESLKAPEESAGFLEAILEEEDPEPELLRNALRKVIEAYRRSNHLSNSAENYQKKLDQILTESGCQEIYTFVELLKELGFRLEIKVENNK